MMTDDEIIAVVQAKKDGKDIQFESDEDFGDKWQDDRTPSWDFESFNYRVKPEQKVLYANIYADGSAGAISANEKQVINCCAENGRTIRLVEDLSYGKGEV